ncbi:MAG TPA: hypothetical protein QF641_04310 [Candidatus Thalassarchaeaceae archaeon]|jgi:tetratricopeptide (TPR) repeat protein|nr:hypothetical protein [Candidatus Thalassarchaeaceae archaeon]|tara:strand:+ start:16003 stop:16308 length:306 start_codon:yes stop_codon:yes gene_type:complete
MAGPRWENVYDLSDEQINQLDQAEHMMETMQLNEAEKILNEMLKESPDCIPALNNLGHLYGRHMSDFELAIEYYDMVITIEPDNAWARDERRRYRRYLSYD